MTSHNIDFLRLFTHKYIVVIKYQSTYEKNFNRSRKNTQLLAQLPSIRKGIKDKNDLNYDIVLTIGLFTNGI